MAAFNLPQLLNNIKHYERGKAEEKAVQLKFRKDEELPAYLTGDPDILAQILHSLINNAIKFTQKGYIIIDSEVKDQNQEIIYLKFSISDTGNDITKEEQHSIFNDQSTLENAKNTSGLDENNLDLGSIKNLIEQQGGTFHFSSIPGEGSCFYFTIPFHLNTSDKQQGMEENHLFKLEKLRDQNHPDRDFVKNMVELFIQTTPEILDYMKQDLKAENYDEVARLAHKLKPSIDMLEITSQKERIRNIENFARNQKNIETLPEMVDELTTGLKKVMYQLDGI